MTTHPVGTRRPASLPGGITGYAGQPATRSSSRTSMTGRSQQDLGDQMSYEQPPRGRLARLFEAADRRHVPLRTILVTAGVVVATYLAGKLMYLLRDIVLLMLVAGVGSELLTTAQG